VVDYSFLDSVMKSISAVKLPLVIFVWLAIFLLAASLLPVNLRAQTVPSGQAATPVLVELFTSEGCSSCPPADALLQKLDAQPFPNMQIIALSEHVDYWNHDGWTDPYSSHANTARQDAYGRLFNLESVYTPQLIVDGSKEFVANDPKQTQKVFAEVATEAKVPVRITNARLENGVIHAHIEIDGPSNRSKGDVDFVVALNQAESQVLKGENAGHRLTHVAVVRSLSKVGKLDPGHAFSQDVSVKLDNPKDSDLRLIVFVQKSGMGRVLGATMEKLTPKSVTTPRESEPPSFLARASLR
jgi:hypothetical protein